MAITSGIEIITPDIAMEILSVQEERNRTVSRLRVKRYTAIMERGEWQLNGESITFDEDGQLMDGQHRLLAVLESMVDLKTMVIRGVPDRAATLPTIDTGKRRTLPDNLGILGHKRAGTLARALGWLGRLLAGPHAIVHHTAPTHAEALATLAEHPEIEGMVLRCSTGDFKKLCPQLGLFIAFSYLLHTQVNQRGRTRAVSFLEGVLTGENLKAHDPRLELRNKWMRIRAARSAGHARVPPLHVLIFNIRAWNAHYSNKDLRRLNLPRHFETTPDAGAIPHVLGWRDGW